MKKIQILLLLVMIAGLSALALTGCGSAQEKETSPSETSTSEAPAKSTNTNQEGEMHKVQIDVKKYGSIVVELDASQAPITVANFLELAKSGFYDGLTFHRIIEGFMIQGGDPEGTGMGGSGNNIKGEFIDNGIENTISHVRGVISMARSGHPDSASSQFFIVHEDSTFLDGQYAAFGKVLEGMDVVDKLATETPVTDSNGTVQSGKQPVIEKITVLN